MRGRVRGPVLFALHMPHVRCGGLGQWGRSMHDNRFRPLRVRLAVKGGACGQTGRRGPWNQSDPMQRLCLRRQGDRNPRPQLTN